MAKYDADKCKAWESLTICHQHRTLSYLLPFEMLLTFLHLIFSASDFSSRCIWRAENFHESIAPKNWVYDWPDSSWRTVKKSFDAFGTFDLCFDRIILKSSCSFNPMQNICIQINASEITKRPKVLNTPTVIL